MELDNTAAEYATEAVNTVPTEHGVRLVCEWCGLMSRPCPTAGMLDLPDGWAIVPFPAGHKQRDGSTGSFYRCPPCTDRRDFPITARAYMEVAA